jgi:hypothetical protein
MALRGKGGVLLRRLALLGLMPIASLAVHQLRYWLAFGSKAGVELQIQGHSYLHSAAPWVVVPLAVVVGIFLSALGRALGGECSVSRYTVSFLALWLVCAVALIAVYVAQEFLEGLIAFGHPAGLAGIFGFGGWWSIPSALAVGLILAAVFHGARWVLREVAERHRAAPRTRPRRSQSARRPLTAVPLRPAPLAGGWSGRGPPA